MKRFFVLLQSMIRSGGIVEANQAPRGRALLRNDVDNDQESC